MESTYEQWLSEQAASCTGERRRRLSQHGHAEELFLKQVWYPAFNHFQNLHGEYEVSDFKDGKRYLDFAYIRSPYRICFEIDGFGPHSRDVDRDRFADGLMRQNHLVLDGWIVIRLSYDDVVKRPRQCQQLLHQLLGKLYNPQSFPDITIHQKEIIRYMMITQNPVSPKEISSMLQVGAKFARRLLLELLYKKYVVSCSAGNQRIRLYKLNDNLPPYSKS
ncbi:DNA-binding response regulator [Paenibacillus radicis (ex Gao et al. 2016)]|uniref:DNA-binding response regulator n=1 Tax=Paenibacillus radicis (ex Gao et al. 2016) TaxID=1737354 RepID=UPI001E5442ED|nr:DNA-binding response regulator [Paenibacillus radicis (ex Gao et al. 2016)]